MGEKVCLKGWSGIRIGIQEEMGGEGCSNFYKLSFKECILLCANVLTVKNSKGVCGCMKLQVYEGRGGGSK